MVYRKQLGGKVTSISAEIDVPKRRLPPLRQTTDPTPDRNNKSDRRYKRIVDDEVESAAEKR